MCLQPITLDPAPGPIPRRVAEWIQAGRLAGKSVDCFDYIPSSAELLHAYLRVIPGKRYCEWGSGPGIGTGIAALLGFRATGIEINAELARCSRELFEQFDLNADVVHASYHDVVVAADVVFVYCWPGQANAVRERFESVMPPGTWLLMADGAERFSAFFRGYGDG
ncbi:hypothetical protein Mal15_27110 [Stieleria maiorica]|uniref:Uncharacterized protein n=1 Tax=Stieleria maiorica TaxID=2795974 RepID=A0A5B9MEK6_9BACT|nr:class I SAM-dependent methyltransferase [Stieleria maiorica]QEF98656.1 hypothetical protein Mal15_27110 [Stieleria maiorica]